MAKKNKDEKEKQWSTEYYTDNKRLITTNHTRPRDELMCSWMVNSATLVTYPEMSHEWAKKRFLIKTNGTYPWSFVTQIFRTG